MYNILVIPILLYVSALAMDVRSLRSFLRVAELGSVSRAAVALNMVQPALSRQINLLEADLGTRLFLRHRRGVILTEAGLLLKQRAAAILSEMEDTRRAVSASGRELSGTVSLGLPTSMLYVLSADLVTRFRTRYPRVFVRIYEGLGHVVEQHLRDDLVDLAVLISPKPMRGVTLAPLAEEQLYVAGPPDSDLDISTPVPLSQLAMLPMIMLSPRNKVRLVVEELLQKQGRAFTAALEVEGQPLAMELVRRGAGYTVLPQCAIAAEMAAGYVRGAPIRKAKIAWVLGSNTMRAGAPAVKVVAELLQDLIRERIGSGVFEQQNR